MLREARSEGLRITVADAGIPGRPLISDVLEVVDGTTLDLAQPALTSVAGVEAVLNRPDRIELNDYARATSTGATIDLQDRTVADAAMIVGQRVLNSPTAQFSSDDLNKQVTVFAAGFRLGTDTRRTPFFTVAWIAAASTSPVSRNERSKSASSNSEYTRR